MPAETCKFPCRVFKYSNDHKRLILVFKAPVQASCYSGVSGKDGWGSYIWNGSSHATPKYYNNNWYEISLAEAHELMGPVLFTRNT